MKSVFISCSLCMPACSLWCGFIHACFGREQGVEFSKALVKPANGQPPAGTFTLRLTEFIDGAARLRGSAKALDVWRGLGVEKFAVGDFLGYGSRGENHHLLQYFDGSKLEVHNWTYWYRMVELDANGGLKIKQVNSTNRSWVLTNQQYHQQ